MIPDNDTGFILGTQRKEDQDFILQPVIGEVLPTGLPEKYRHYTYAQEVLLKSLSAVGFNLNEFYKPGKISGDRYIDCFSPNIPDTFLKPFVLNSLGYYRDYTGETKTVVSNSNVDTEFLGFTYYMLNQPDTWGLWSGIDKKYTWRIRVYDREAAANLNPYPTHLIRGNLEGLIGEALMTGAPPEDYLTLLLYLKPRVFQVVSEIKSISDSVIKREGKLALTQPVNIHSVVTRLMPIITQFIICRSDFEDEIERNFGYGRGNTTFNWFARAANSMGCSLSDCFSVAIVPASTCIKSLTTTSYNNVRRRGAVYFNNFHYNRSWYSVLVSVLTSASSRMLAMIAAFQRVKDHFENEDKSGDPLIAYPVGHMSRLLELGLGGMQMMWSLYFSGTSIDTVAEEVLRDLPYITAADDLGNLSNNITKRIAQRWTIGMELPYIATSVTGKLWLDRAESDLGVTWSEAEELLSYYFSWRDSHPQSTYMKLSYDTLRRLLFVSFMLATSPDYEWNLEIDYNGRIPRGVGFMSKLTIKQYGIGDIHPDLTGKFIL